MGQSRTPPMQPCPFAIAAITVPARRWETRTDLMVQIARAEQFMREAPLGEVSIRDAASVAGLSLHHFIRLFHHVYSESPRRFMGRLQFERARELLAKSEWRVHVSKATRARRRLVRSRQRPRWKPHWSRSF